MSAQVYPLQEMLIDTESVIKLTPLNTGDKLAFSTDTKELFLLDGTRWYKFEDKEVLPVTTSSKSSSSSSSK